MTQNLAASLINQGVGCGKVDFEQKKTSLRGSYFFLFVASRRLGKVEVVRGSARSRIQAGCVNGTTNNQTLCRIAPSRPGLSLDIPSQIARFCNTTSARRDRLTFLCEFVNIDTLLKLWKKQKTAIFSGFFSLGWLPAIGAENPNTLKDGLL